MYEDMEMKKDGKNDKEMKLLKNEDDIDKKNNEIINNYGELIEEKKNDIIMEEKL
jgi:hypothetical protein